MSPPVDAPCSWHFSSTRATCLFHSGFHCCIKLSRFILLAPRLCGSPELHSTTQHSSLCFCGPWAGCAPEQPHHRKNSLRVTVNQQKLLRAQNMVQSQCGLLSLQTCSLFRASFFSLLFSLLTLWKRSLEPIFVILRGGMQLEDQGQKHLLISRGLWAVVFVTEFLSISCSCMSFLFDFNHLRLGVDSIWMCYTVLSILLALIQ